MEDNDKNRIYIVRQEFSMEFAFVIMFFKVVMLLLSPFAVFAFMGILK